MNLAVRSAFRALHREELGSRKKPAAGSIADDDAFRKLWELSAQLPMDRRRPERLD
ncbi:MAG: hypothetical protein ABR905_13170 [Terracidiphilus sp.]